MGNLIDIWRKRGNTGTGNGEQGEEWMVSTLKLISILIFAPMSNRHWVEIKTQINFAPEFMNFFWLSPFPLPPEPFSSRCLIFTSQNLQSRIRNETGEIRAPKSMGDVLKSCAGRNDEESFSNLSKNLDFLLFCVYVTLIFNSHLSCKEI